MISGVFAVLLVIVMLLFFSADAFYVHTISVAGLDYLRKDEIFRWTNIADLHIFWIDPDVVRERLLEVRAIADAEVFIGWPPDMVRIVVHERQPALIWEQADIETWVDIQGKILMIPPEERPDLLRVVVEDVDIPVHPEQIIPPTVVNGTLQLRELMPELSVLRYHQDNGLGFTAPGGWDVWFGDGTHMDEKLNIYRTLVSDLQADGVTLSYIRLMNPDAPSYCISGQACASKR